MALRSKLKKALSIPWAASSLACLSCYLLLLAGLGLLVLPKLINEKDLQAMINQRLAQTLRAEVSIEAMELGFLPAPNVSLQDIVLSIPEIGLARCQQLKVFPDLPALLTGRFRLEHIHAQGPDIRIDRWPGGRASSKEPMSWNSLMQRLPRINVSIQGALVSIQGSPLGYVELKPAQARLSIDKNIRLSMEGDSNLAKQIDLEVEADRDLAAVRGECRAQGIDLGQFKPYLPSLPAGIHLADCELDLDAAWSLSQRSELQAEFQGAVPSLQLGKGPAAHEMEIGHYQGSLHWMPDKAGLRLEKLVFLEPAMHLSGAFHLDRSQGSFQLQASGEDIPIEPVRAICGDFIGHKEKVARVLHIVRGGRAEVTFSGAGKDLKDLESSLKISGRLEEGRIHVPKLDLDLTEVQGTYVIQDKSLHVVDIAAELKETRILKAELELGLNDELQPLRLSCNLQADLAQGPPIMRQVIEHRPFLRHLSRISELKGRGRGRLRIIRDQEEQSVEVSLQGVSLQARYKLLPFPVRIKNGDLHYKDRLLTVQGANFSIGSSSFRAFDGYIRINQDSFLEIKQARGSLALSEIVPWLHRQNGPLSFIDKPEAIKGRLRISSLRFQGPLFRPSEWDFKGSGSVDQIRYQQPMLPGTIRIPEGGFQVDQETIILNDMRLGQRGSEATVSGEVSRYLRFPPSLKLNMRGSLDAEELAWVWNRFALPQELALQPPVEVKQLNLSWKPKQRLSLTGQLKAGGSVKLSVDLNSYQQILALKHLYIEDGQSQARIGLQVGPKEASFRFSGSLAPQTAERLLARNTLLQGSLQGNFETAMHLLPWAITSAQGKLDINGFKVPKSLIKDLSLQDVELQATGEKVDFKKASLVWSGSSLDLDGQVYLARKVNRFDLIMQGDKLHWKTLQDMVSTPGEQEDMGRVLSRVEGNLHFDIGRFHWQGFEWTKVQADLDILSGGKINLSINHADLCGIDTKGSIRMAPAPLSMSLRAQAEEKNLKDSLFCLYQGEKELSGSFDLSCRLEGRGQNATAMAGSLKGPLRFTSREGRIYRLNLLAKIFGVLNTTEIFFGEIPDLEQDGFGYNAIDIEGRIKQEKLLLKKGLIDGKTMEIGFQGEVHLTEQTVDLIVLVAPLKTVDRIFKRIPLLSHILGGNLISIPFRVSGDLSDPRVTPLSPKAVSSEVLDIMKRTLELPVKIFQPFMPDKE